MKTVTGNMRYQIRDEGRRIALGRSGLWFKSHHFVPPTLSSPITTTTENNFYMNDKRTKEEAQSPNCRYFRDLVINKSFISESVAGKARSVVEMGQRRAREEEGYRENFDPFVYPRNFEPSCSYRSYPLIRSPSNREHATYCTEKQRPRQTNTFLDSPLLQLCAEDPSVSAAWQSGRVPKSTYVRSDSTCRDRHRKPHFLLAISWTFISLILDITVVTAAFNRAQHNRKHPYWATSPRLFLSAAHSKATARVVKIVEEQSRGSYLQPNRKVGMSKKKRLRKGDAVHWERMVEKLRGFVELHGHAVVPSTHADTELYQWTQTTRRNFKALYHETMNSQEWQSEVELPSKQNDDKDDENIAQRDSDDIEWFRFQQLQELGFVFDVQEYKWNRKYLQLRQFYADHGHTRVANNDQQYPSLGVWVRNQRREYKKLLKEQEHNDEEDTALPQSSRSTLTKRRLQLLEEIGFEWYKSHHDVWMQRYHQLQDYKKVNGHTNVPQQYSANPALGKWVMNQRSAFRQHEELQKDSRNLIPTTYILTEERIRLLNELGFSWKNRDDQWYHMLAQLKNYYLEHGHINIPVADEADDADNGTPEVQDLRTWLIRQRFQFNNFYLSGKPSPLTKERKEALERSVPNFKWKRRAADGAPSSKDWAKLFDAMRAKGLRPGMRPKQHWFEGTNPLSYNVSDKQIWTEQDLLELWNQETDDEDDDEDDQFDIDGDSSFPGSGVLSKQPNP